MFLNGYLPSLESKGQRVESLLRRNDGFAVSKGGDSSHWKHPGAVSSLGFLFRKTCYCMLVASLTQLLLTLRIPLHDIAIFGMAVPFFWTTFESPLHGISFSAQFLGIQQPAAHAQRLSQLCYETWK